MNSKEQPLGGGNDGRKPDGYSRRTFLDTSLKALAGAVLLSQKSDTYIPSKDHPTRKELEKEIARPSAEIKINRTESKDNVEVTPEYQRHLERLFMIVPPEFRYTTSRGWNGPLEWLRQNMDFFASLPEYTKMDLVTDKHGEPVLREALDKMGIKTEINIRPMWTDNMSNLGEWSQDVGEICRINGKDIFIIPKTYKRYPKTKGRELVWKKMAQQLFNIENVEEADFYFQGGNMTFDTTEQGLRVFIGFDDLRIGVAQDLDIDSRDLVPADHQAELRHAAEKISKQFGGAEVIVMGNKKQSQNLIHIDQSFILLDDKNVVVAAVRDTSLPEHELQEYYKKQLEELGYKIATLEHTEEEVRNTFASLNAVPFVDRQTREKKIIYPVFPPQTKGDFNATEPITKDSLRGTALKAYELFESLGYKPYPVRDHGYKKKSNTHCITNVLASLDNPLAENDAAIG